MTATITDVESVLLTRAEEAEAAVEALGARCEELALRCDALETEVAHQRDVAHAARAMAEERCATMARANMRLRALLDEAAMSAERSEPLGRDLLSRVLGELMS